jgi:hypothetical protein
MGLTQGTEKSMTQDILPLLVVNEGTASTPVYRIPDDATLPQLQQLRADLQRELLALQEDIGGIRAQLESAQSRFAETGVYADRVWYRRANDALRHKGRLHQSYQLLMTDIGKRIRALNVEVSAVKDTSDEREFVRFARLLLPEETYAGIWREVNALKLMTRTTGQRDKAMTAAE